MRSERPWLRITRRTRGAFTLIELLVVIGILTLLIAILLPLLGKARTAAFVSSTQARVGMISTAIEQYYGMYQAYPGPLPDNEIITSNAAAVQNYQPLVTSTENCLLGLLGGWEVGAGVSNSGINDANGGYMSTKVGGGPALFGAAVGQRGALVGEVHSMGLPAPTNASGGWTPIPGTPLQSACVDTVVPEFMDAFPDPMPIIYLRAHVGATGMVYPDTDPQYDLGQVYPYLRSAPIANVNGGAFPDPAYPTVGGLDATHSYVANVAGNSSTGITEPVHKDQFILIAAGKPNGNGVRVYGTTNDIRN